MTDNEKQEICRKCAECCKDLIIPIMKSSDLVQDQKVFYEARGIEILRETQKYFVGKMKFRCPNLLGSIDTFSCSGYEYRPEVCKRYDGRLIPAWHGINCEWK